jgi:hypothetical protein
MGSVRPQRRALWRRVFTMLWPKYTRVCRPVSKTMSLLGIALLVSGGVLLYEGVGQRIAWAGAALLGGAIAFRLFWNS